MPRFPRENRRLLARLLKSLPRQTSIVAFKVSLHSEKNLGAKYSSGHPSRWPSQRLSRPPKPLASSARVISVLGSSNSQVRRLATRASDRTKTHAPKIESANRLHSTASPGTFARQSLRPPLTRARYRRRRQLPADESLKERHAAAVQQSHGEIGVRILGLLQYSE